MQQPGVAADFKAGHGPKLTVHLTAPRLTAQPCNSTDFVVVFHASSQSHIYRTNDDSFMQNIDEIQLATALSRRTITYGAYRPGSEIA
jgi:hypothetical protein